MSDKGFGCSANISSDIETEEIAALQDKKLKGEKQMLKVGKPVPDFTLQGYHKGEFKNFNLSDYRGKWVLLCFYPGDFTFV